MTLRHVVSWKLATTDPAERAAQGAEIQRLLGAVRGAVPGLLALEVGLNAAGPEGNWDVVLISDFADEAALEAYQVHPLHVAAGTFIRSVVAARSAVDFLV